MKIRMLHPAVGEFSFPIDPGGQAVLGRRGADVEITWDRRISRRHARVWAEGTRLFFEDLGSRNGSYIGNDRLTGTVELQPGMSVLLGQTALLIPNGAEAKALGDLDQTYEAPAHDLGLPPEPVGTQDLLPHLLSQDLGLPATVTTGDLPIVAADTAPDAPAPAEVAASTHRRYPRLVSRHLAQVEINHREELRQLWVRDISKGGVFIETGETTPTGTRLEVRLQTPDGTLSLHGQVVHVVDEASAQGFNMPPGVGVQFIDLNNGKRRAIQEYVDGLRERLSIELTAAPNGSDARVDGLIERARAFVAAAESDELYRALDVEPSAAQSIIQTKVDTLHRQLDEAVRLAPPPQRARVEAAHGLLKKVGRLMTSAESRLEYDLRHGHIRARERLAAAHAGTGPSMEVLRRTWNRVSHDRVDQAALLTRRAFAARQAKRWDEAIKYAKQALTLNPFFEELEKTLEAWELAASAELAPTFSRRASSRAPSRTRRSARP